MSPLPPVFPLDQEGQGSLAVRQRPRPQVPAIPWDPQHRGFLEPLALPSNLSGRSDLEDQDLRRVRLRLVDPESPVDLLDRPRQANLGRLESPDFLEFLTLPLDPLRPQCRGVQRDLPEHLRHRLPNDESSSCYRAPGVFTLKNPIDSGLTNGPKSPQFQLPLQRQQIINLERCPSRPGDRPRSIDRQ